MHKDTIIIKDGIFYKKCSGECGLEKVLSKENFQWRNSSGKFGHQCKICIKESNKDYNKKNKEKIAKYQKEYCGEHKEEMAENKKEWYKENKEEILECKKEYYKENKEEIKKYKKEWYQENKEEINKKNNKRKNIRRQSDPLYKLMDNISAQVRHMLKGKKAGKSTKNLLPFTTEQLIEHMEKLFKEPGNEWMNWGNQGVFNVDKWNEENSLTWVWNLDHITPVSHFDITDLEHPENDKEFLECWDLSNLRPLSAKQNIEEGSRR